MRTPPIAGTWFQMGARSIACHLSASVWARITLAGGGPWAVLGARRVSFDEIDEDVSAFSGAGLASNEGVCFARRFSSSMSSSSDCGESGFGPRGRGPLIVFWRPPSFFSGVPFHPLPGPWRSFFSYRRDVRFRVPCSPKFFPSVNRINAFFVRTGFRLGARSGGCAFFSLRRPLSSSSLGFPPGRY